MEPQPVVVAIEVGTHSTKIITKRTGKGNPRAVPCTLYPRWNGSRGLQGSNKRTNQLEYSTVVRVT